LRGEVAKFLPDFAIERRLPAILESRAFAEAVGLMSCGSASCGAW
jgi:hypothetical protein